MLQIIKRNNNKVFFDKQKIVNAINNAFLEVDGVLYEQDTANDIANDIEEIAKENIKTHIFTVEDIQDLVEEFLMRSERKDVARAYIRYRYKKEVARERSFEFKQAVVDKLMAKNIQNQNANVDEASFGGRTGEASGFVTKQLALEDVVSENARQNHNNNIIYIHDLDNYYVGSHNCLSIPFDDLLEKGFITRQTSVRPAQSIDTAFQLIAVIFQLQSLNQFGGVSATHLDWTMVPYVRKSYYSHLKDALKFMADKYTYKSFCCEYKRIKKDAKVSILNPDWSEYFGGINIPKQAYKYAYEQTQKEVYKAADGMLHNLNTLQSRSGNQLPFTSINYGTCTMPEGRMVTKAILDCTITGIGKNYRTPVFPCQIFQCMRGVNRKPGDANYDLFKIALESTSKRLYPNYANVDWSGNAGYDINDPRTYFSTMGCRTANGWDINGFGQLKDGRGNICPVTIILPTIAMQAKEQFIKSDNRNYYNTEQGKIDLINYFLRRLDQKIFEAKDMLLERFEWICSQPAASAKFMYQNNVMKGYVPEEGIRSALKHGTLALG